MDSEIKRQVNALNTSGVDMSRVDLEETAIDKVAYQQWKKMMELPQLKNTQVTASDGTLIKMGSPKPIFVKMIANLSEEEQEQFTKKKGVYDTLNLKAGNLKIRAFGLRQGKGAEKSLMHIKMLDSKRLELIELFGRMFSVQEVHQIVVEEWQIPIGVQHLIKFRQDNGALIEEKIKAHKTSFSDIRLGVKRSRLEEYCWIYGQSKQRYNTVNNREDLKVMISVLDKIKDETEVQQLQVNVSGQVDINLTVEQHAQKEVLKGLGLRQIILGRVAARMGNLSPALLIARLSASYYTKFAVMDDEEASVEYSDVQYPTKEHYDFDQIHKLNQEQLEAVKLTEEQERLNLYRNSQPIKKDNTKGKLLALLKAERDKVTSVRSSAEAADLNRDLGERKQMSTKQKLKSLVGK